MQFRSLSVLTIFLLVLFFVFSCSQKDSAMENHEDIQSNGAHSATTVNRTNDNALLKNTTHDESRHLKVFYFLSNYRCPSCIYIEETTQATVAEVFAEQIKTGRVSFQALNIDLPENQHFVNDYKLFSQSVILSDIKDEKEQRWVNLEKVWQFYNNDKRFKQYIEKEIRKYLE